MTSISLQAVTFFAGCCLLLASQKKWLAAICMAALSHSSQTNGILCWPLLITIAFINDRKNFLSISIKVIAIGLFCHLILAYAFRNIMDPHTIYISDAIKELGIIIKPLDAYQFSKSYLILLGISWINFSNESLAAITGSIIGIIVIFNAYKTFNKSPTMIFIFSFIAFNALTLLGVVYSRPIYFENIDFSLYNKYRLNSILIITLTLFTFFIKKD